MNAVTKTATTQCTYDQMISVLPLSYVLSFCDYFIIILNLIIVWCISVVSATACSVDVTVNAVTKTAATQYTYDPVIIHEVTSVLANCLIILMYLFQSTQQQRAVLMSQ